MNPRRIIVIASNSSSRPSKSRAARIPARSAVAAEDAPELFAVPVVEPARADAPVYVDKPYRFRGRDPHTIRAGARHDHNWCHLWSDDVEALHRMADRLHLNRQWFHDRRRGDKEPFPHYNVLPPKRALALQYGAIERSVRDALRERASRRRAETLAERLAARKPVGRFG